MTPRTALLPLLASTYGCGEVCLHTPGLCDMDEDGAFGDTDCDDGDPSTYPDAMETCRDGHRNDCQDTASTAAAEACRYQETYNTSNDPGDDLVRLPGVAQTINFGFEATYLSLQNGDPMIAAAGSGAVTVLLMESCTSCDQGYRTYTLDLPSADSASMSAPNLLGVGQVSGEEGGLLVSGTIEGGGPIEGHAWLLADLTVGGAESTTEDDHTLSEANGEVSAEVVYTVALTDSAVYCWGTFALASATADPAAGGEGWYAVGGLQYTPDEEDPCGEATGRVVVLRDGLLPDEDDEVADQVLALVAPEESPADDWGMHVAMANGALADGDVAVVVLGEGAPATDQAAAVHLYQGEDLRAAEPGEVEPTRTVALPDNWTSIQEVNLWGPPLDDATGDTYGWLAISYRAPDDTQDDADPQPYLCVASADQLRTVDQLTCTITFDAQFTSPVGGGALVAAQPVDIDLIDGLDLPVARTADNGTAAADDDERYGLIRVYTDFQHLSGTQPFNFPASGDVSTTIQAGSSEDYLGVSMETRKDWNRDGYPDLVFGTPGAENDYGAVFVLLGAGI